MNLDLTVIIPFKDLARMTITCLDTLLEHNDGIKEVLLVSNNSSDEELELVRQAAGTHDNVKLLIYNHPFNYQKINNFAARQAKGKVIMLLNNDIELVPQSAGLLEHMYKEALDAKTGAVGCILLYEDRKAIQHAGIYLVAGGMAMELYRGKNYLRTLQKIAEQPSAMPDIRQDRPMTAVTAAAVMVERSKYRSVDGLNEDFLICGGDVDLCLRLTAKGYPSRLVGADHGYMIHKESKSRSLLGIPYVDFVESYKSYSKHFDPIKGDPNLTQEELMYANQ